jgi:hypothetical protein
MGDCQSTPARRATANKKNSCHHNNTSNDKKQPLMSAEDRATTKQIIVDHYVQEGSVDVQFIIHFSRVKAKMHNKLLQARDNLATITNEAAETTLAHANTLIDNFNTTMMEQNYSRYITKTPKINSLQHSLQIPTQHQSRESKIRDGIQLFEERMTSMKLQQIVMKDDGNCQFRSIAHQLYGTAEDGNHQRTRALCVTYLTTHSDQFACYFDGALEWQQYLSTMLLDGTWGDELTLKAASNVLHCTVHVLTSEKEHYYMCYVPDNEDDTTTTTTNNNNNGTNDAAESKSNNNASSHYCDDIFLAYISPIHYNSIQLIQ